VLRASFAPQSAYRRLPIERVTAGIPGLPVPLPRPNAALASDTTLDSVWIARNRNAVLIWKSGLVETIQLWRCHCTFASEFRRSPSGFRHLTIGGSPALAHVSDPHAISIGIETAAMRKYGTAAVVETIRSGLRIVLYQYGAETLPGLLDTARTLPTDAAFGQVISDGATKVIGGTAAQRDLLSSILRGVSSKEIPQVTIGTPPAPYRAKGRSWLTFALPGDQDTSNLGIWETWLVAGAFREMSVNLRMRGSISRKTATDLPVVFGYSDLFPSSTVPLSGTFPRDAAHPTSSVDAETVMVSIERRLARARLSLVSLTFAKPFNLAPIVVARTYDPDAQKAGWRPDASPIADDGLLEGSFFEVVDVSGKVVFFVGHATRTQSGVGSTGHGHRPYIPTQ
jgi:hypothetical protein